MLLCIFTVIAIIFTETGLLLRNGGIYSHIYLGGEFENHAGCCGSRRGGVLPYSRNRGSDRHNLSRFQCQVGRVIEDGDSVARCQTCEDAFSSQGNLIRSGRVECDLCRRPCHICAVDLNPRPNRPCPTWRCCPVVEVQGEDDEVVPCGPDDDVLILHPRHGKTRRRRIGPCQRRSRIGDVEGVAQKLAVCRKSHCW
jgi:hypothetical protein